MDLEGSLDDVAGSEHGDGQRLRRVPEQAHDAALQHRHRPAATGDAGKRLPDGHGTVEYAVEFIASGGPDLIEAVQRLEIDPGIGELGAILRPAGIGEGPSNGAGGRGRAPSRYRVPDRQPAGDDAVDHARRALRQVVGGPHLHRQQGHVAEVRSASEVGAERNPTQFMPGTGRSVLGVGAQELDLVTSGRDRVFEAEPDRGVG